ncbi:PLDc N-terminal domain-containing protein [Desulfatitalea alkaliphila]|uniref:PLDc N-terminal domain-containing protein n=1 Tax=Desulfatitalea alkaliphila TaxID=2929485 RepID=A0AA41R2V1_9BACT|nr:PLDc N-terminal domain-containing protein [Desulfatitalea alkaliphila]MCJ8502022.1 PLDc N-terminal domain-containing protein [Desulfatitalea alkaliphila]
MTLTYWIILTGVLFYLLTCWAIVDIARKDFGGIEKKAGWAFIALIPFLGPVLYLVLGYRKGRRAGEVPPA